MPGKVIFQRDMVTPSPLVTKNKNVFPMFFTVLL